MAHLINKESKSLLCCYPVFRHNEDLANAANRGYSKIMISTVDNDVLVLDAAAVQQLAITELWLVFTLGKTFIYLSAH